MVQAAQENAQKSQNLLYHISLKSLGSVSSVNIREIIYDLPKVPNPTMIGRSIFCNMFATYTSYGTGGAGNVVENDRVAV